MISKIFEQIGQDSLQSQAYEYVKKLILTNKLNVDGMYSETKLAAELGISRTPLRQALHRLSQDGYITIYPSKGFMIRHLTEKDMIETIQVRCAIEGFSTYFIIKEKNKIKRETFFSKIENLIECMKKEKYAEDNNEAFMEYDHIFHLEIVKFVENEEFIQIFQRLIYFIHLTSRTSLLIPGRIDSTIKEHEEYIQYLKNHDEIGAYNIMMKHLEMPIKLISNRFNN